MNRKNAILEAQQAFAAGASIEVVIQMLRERGLTKMETMIVLEDDLGVVHSDAKLAVHRSEAWKDYREAAEALEKELLDSEEP